MHTQKSSIYVLNNHTTDVSVTEHEEKNVHTGSRSILNFFRCGAYKFYLIRTDHTILIKASSQKCNVHAEH